MRLMTSADIWIRYIWSGASKQAKLCQNHLGSLSDFSSAWKRDVNVLSLSVFVSSCMSLVCLTYLSTFLGVGVCLRFLGLDNRLVVFKMVGFISCTWSWLLGGFHLQSVHVYIRFLLVEQIRLRCYGSTFVHALYSSE